MRSLNLLVFGSILILSLCPTFNKQVWAQKKSPEIVSAAKLSQAFADDDAAARKKYSMTQVIVEGTVLEIEKNKSGNVYVLLNGHADGWRVCCDFEGKDAKTILETVKLKQKLNAAGVVYSPAIPKEILVGPCKIVPSSPQPDSKIGKKVEESPRIN